MFRHVARVCRPPVLSRCCLYQPTVLRLLSDTVQSDTIEPIGNVQKLVLFNKPLPFNNYYNLFQIT